MKSIVSKPFTKLFALGTVQLGMDYGIANKGGQPDLIMAESIVKTAWDNGIREFDTAQAYGESEKILGTVLKNLGISDKAKIISKPDPSLDYCNTRVIEKSIDISLHHLGCSSLYCYMLHREELLALWDKKIGEILVSMVRNKSIENIGISVYSPEKAIEALNIRAINFIQLPANILDRRFEDFGVFELAQKKNKTIYIRSVFLQGLVLMSLKDLPENMSFAKPALNKINKLSLDLNLTKQELAIAYIMNAYPDAKILLGIDNLEQIMMNIEIFQRDYSIDIVTKVKSYLNDTDERVLNPSRWF